MTFLLVNFAVKNATVFFPFLLSRTGLTISVSLLPVSDAVQCNRSCSALHPSLQCTVSVHYNLPVLWHTAAQAAESCAWVSYVMRTGARRGSSKIIPIWEDPP